VNFLSEHQASAAELQRQQRFSSLVFAVKAFNRKGRKERKEPLDDIRVMRCINVAERIRVRISDL
jgi:hypothetical protein